MRSVLIPLMLVVFLCCSPVSAATVDISEADGTGVTVLIYHRFGEDKYPTTNVAVSRFKEQLEFLKNNKYRVIPLEQLISALKMNGELPERAVVITIDDGYRSVYTDAWPVLKEYGYPFTVFVYTKATENNHWNYMNWEQIRELQAAGVDFQNHGFAHDHMAFRPSGMTVAEYRSWIREDLAVSTKLMSEELKEHPRFFAIPYGEYNKILLEEIKAFGYEAILLQDPGSVSRDTDPFAIPREPILGKDWATLEHFKMVLERVDLPIRAEVPGFGQLSENPPELFSAKLLYPDRYLPGTLGIYVSELGWQKADLMDDTAVIQNSSLLKRQVNRVAVSGREKESGRTAIRYWMLIRE